MRFTAMALIVTLGFLGLGLGTSSTLHAQEASAWRKVAEAIPLGSKVKVQMFEGRRISGTLMGVDDKAIQVKKNTRLPEAAVTVTFDEIANLGRDHGGMNWAKALGIGAAAGAGAILTIFVIALQLD